MPDATNQVDDNIPLPDRPYNKRPWVSVILISLGFLLAVIGLFVFFIHFCGAKPGAAWKWGSLSGILVGWLIYWKYLFDLFWSVTKKTEVAIFENELSTSRKGKDLTDPTVELEGIESAAGGLNPKLPWWTASAIPITTETLSGTINVTDMKKVGDKLMRGGFTLKWTATVATVSGYYAPYQKFTKGAVSLAELTARINGSIEAGFSEDGADGMKIRADRKGFAKSCLDKIHGGRALTSLEARLGLKVTAIEIGAIDENDATLRAAEAARVTAAIKTASDELAGIEGDPTVRMNIAAKAAGVDVGDIGYEKVVIEGLEGGYFNYMKGGGGRPGKQQGNKKNQDGGKDKK